MKSCLNKQTVERAKPLLGTLVSIRVEGLEREAALAAMDAAFDEVALVHRLMSFHEQSSDIRRLNRQASSTPVEVHPYSFEVLELAQKLSAETEGIFDITVGAELVRWRHLPVPADSGSVPNGNWRDVELLSQNRVMLRCPLWLDVGGIAKGFAVDRAAACLKQWNVPAFLINAGGDMRVHGEGIEQVALAAAPQSEDEPLAPVLEINNASLAGSRSPLLEEWQEDRIFGPHVDGAQRTPIPPGRFACVVAEDCIVADALTKVVMTLGGESDEILTKYGAIAYLHDPATGWLYLNEKMEEA